jgi:ubiquinone/menaquinone biosynthesis C-methylase UbiE
MLATRHYPQLAAAWIRGAHPELVRADDDSTIAAALAAGIDLFAFKRREGLARVDVVLSLLRGLAPSSLLDLGFGRGSFLFPLLDAFPELPVTAVERKPSAVARVEAMARGGHPGLTALEADACAIPLPDRGHDVVTILEVLEHLERPDLAAREALRCAQRFVIASVPSKPDDNPEHIQLFSARELEALFLEAGARRVSLQHVLNHRVAVVGA